MINITIYKQSNYPIKATEIKKVVKETLEKEGIISDCVVEIALVSEVMMTQLNKDYYKDEKYEHPVFTFTENEGPFVFPPDDKIHLGEIVISYPKAVDTARSTGKLIDDVVKELAVHGALHLVGIHHD